MIEMQESNNLPYNTSPKSRYRTSLRQERKWWKKLNPTIIHLENNHFRIKEIFWRCNRLDARLCKHTWEINEKNILFVKNEINLLINLT